MSNADPHAYGNNTIQVSEWPNGFPKSLDEEPCDNCQRVGYHKTSCYRAEEQRSPPAPWSPLSAGDSLALFNRIARIEGMQSAICDAVRELRECVSEIRAWVKPAEKKPRPPAQARISKPQEEALRALAEVSGVPPIGRDREALRSLVKAHGEDAVFTALHAVKEDFIAGRGYQRAPAQFINRNLIAEAGRRAALRGNAAPKVATWRPE